MFTGYIYVESVSNVALNDKLSRMTETKSLSLSKNFIKQDKKDPGVNIWTRTKSNKNAVTLAV